MRTDPDTPGAPRRWYRDVPGPVWWVTATFAVLLVAYSILQPTYRGPDEPQHVDLAYAFSQDLSYPQWDGRRTDAGLLRSTRLAGFGSRPVQMGEDEEVDREKRPSLEDLADPGKRTRLNQLPQHPPLYYAVLGTADRVVDAVVPGDPFDAYDQQVWFFRLCSCLMVTPLPLLGWVTARRLGLPRPVGITASLLPLAIPQLTHIGSVVNNDNLFVLLVACLTPVLASIALGDLRTPTLALAGGIVGLALFTKGMALALPLWVAMAVATGRWRREPRSLRALATPVGAAAALALALGGWWWLRNLLVFDQLAPSTEYDRFSAVEGRDTGVTRWLHAWAYYTNKRFWGDFGWLDVALSSKVLVAATVTTVAALVLSFRRRPFGLTIGPRLVLFASWPLLAGFTAYNAYQLYQRSGRLPLMQGRYWFGAVVALAVLVAVGLSALLWRGLRWLPLVAVALVATMQTFGIATIFGWYWGLPGTPPGDRVDVLTAWAPFPAHVLGGGLVIGVLVALATVVSLVVEPWSRAERPARAPSPTPAAQKVPA